MQVWECYCGGEHRKRMAGSYFPKDTCCFWFWNLSVFSFSLFCWVVEFVDFDIYKEILMDSHWILRTAIAMVTAALSS
jgi:hypothetical protein